MIVLLETSLQIWVNFPDLDLKSLIFLFLYKSLLMCGFGIFLNSLTLNFNLVSELQTYALKFCYNVERKEEEGLQIYELGSDILLSPLHGNSKSSEISSLRFEIGL